MAEMGEVIEEHKASVIVAVLEPTIKLLEGLENIGSWNMVGWREGIGRSTSEPVVSIQDPTLQPMEGGEKMEVVIILHLRFYLVKIFLIF